MWRDRTIGSAYFGCLRETEVNKGFRHGLDVESLRLAERVMGPETFRGYVVRDSQGHVVSGGIRLHASGHQAVDWVQGASRPALADGVNQLMYDFVMTDLHESGATSFDLAGANIREVAAVKSSWGYPLAPQLRLEQGGVLREVRRAAATSPAVRRIRHRVGVVKGGQRPVAKGSRRSGTSGA